MDASARPLAVVTGASSGIGFELAVQCARHGFDLVIAADRPLDDAVATLRAYRAGVEALQVDLSTVAGVDRLVAAIGDRPVDALLANAGQGVGSAFLDLPFEPLRRVIDTNVTGTLYLLHTLVRRMRERRAGRVLITGSIAGVMPGTFHAVYNGSKAFLDSFSWALRSELEGSGVTVTCLMPGATDTGFFARAGLTDTRLAQQKKDDPARVARLGFDAMMAGEGGVVTGLRNKLQWAAARVTPSAALAAAHGMLARPGSARTAAGGPERAATTEGMEAVNGVTGMLSGSDEPPGKTARGSRRSDASASREVPPREERRAARKPRSHAKRRGSNPPAPADGH